MQGGTVVDVTDGGESQSPDHIIQPSTQLPLQSSPASEVPRPAGASARRASLEAAARGGSARAIAQLAQLDEQQGSQLDEQQGSQQQGSQQQGSQQGSQQQAPDRRANSAPAEPVRTPQSGEECWFLRADGEGAPPNGPFTSREMKRRYLKGLVSHESLVRFLPGVDANVPTAAAQEDKAFAPLRELCTAAGPPFMEGA